MRARGFSMVELMVVVAVISIGGSLAVFAMSDQVSAARARSDELGVFMRLKTERNAARERLTPMGVTSGGSGVINFHLAKVLEVTAGVRVCEVGEIVRTAQFADASIRPNGQLCLDDQGRPVGDFSLVIEAKDGRESTLIITSTGVIESSLNNTTKDIAVDDEIENPDIFVDNAGP